MNVQEFAKLKPGDQITNGMNPGSLGTIEEATESGVRLRWGHQGAQTFYYSVQSTAWFHWERVPSNEPEPPAPDLELHKP